MGEWDVVKEEKLDPWAVVEEKPGGDFLGALGGEPRAFDAINSIARNAPAIGGDILMSLLANKLPPARSLLGPRMAKTVQTGLGGAVGAMGGEYAAQRALDEPTDVEKIKEQGAMGFGGNLGIQGFVAALRPAVRAVKPALDPLFNFATDLTIMGSRRKQALRARLLTDVTKDAEEFVYSVAPEAVKNADVGIDSLRVKMQTALDENKAVYAAYQNALRQAAEKDGGIFVDDTQQFLADKLKEHYASGKKIGTFFQETFGYSPSQDREALFALRNILKTTEDAGLPANVADVESALAKVYGSKYEKISHETWATNRVKLKEAIMGDMDRYAEAAGLKKEADATVKAVSQFKFLTDRILKPAMPGGVLDPGKLAETIYLNKKGILQRDELKELWPALEKKAKLYNDVAGTLDKTAPGLNFADGAQKGIGAAAGYLGMGAEGAAAAEVFGYLSAYALLPQMSKTALQRVLETGAEVTAKTGLRLGNDIVNFNRNE